MPLPAGTNACRRRKRQLEGYHPRREPAARQAARRDTPTRRGLEVGRETSASTERAPMFCCPSVDRDGAAPTTTAPASRATSDSLSGRSAFRTTPRTRPYRPYRARTARGSKRRPGGPRDGAHASARPPTGNKIPPSAGESTVLYPRSRKRSAIAPPSASVARMPATPARTQVAELCSRSQRKWPSSTRRQARKRSRMGAAKCGGHRLVLRKHCEV